MSNQNPPFDFDFGFVEAGGQQTATPAQEAEALEDRRIRVTSNRSITTTPVFDTYWRYAVERQAIFFRRIVGQAPPWTADRILREHRFTNVYRASDRVTQYLIRHVLYEGSQAPDEIFFRALLFKLFNRIDTWRNLVAHLGLPTWAQFDPIRYRQVLDAQFAAEQRLYSAAYIMPSPAFGSPRKHQNHLLLLEHMMRTGAPHLVAEARSLRGVFDVLKSYNSIGDFLAFQFAIDLNYSELIDFDERDFVVAGPGARNGIRKCFADTGGLEEAALIRFVAEAARDEFARRGLSFRDLWDRPLQLIDCQNIFCEVDKYARVAHPTIQGISGRSRIKQRFSPDLSPLPQWYPPKWNLTVHDVRA